MKKDLIECNRNLIECNRDLIDQKSLLYCIYFSKNNNDSSYANKVNKMACCDCETDHGDLQIAHQSC